MSTVTVAYLRLCGGPLRCVRCGRWYEQVKLRPSRTGETWVHCPSCESELLAKPAWADTYARTLLGAGLLAAAALWLMVLL